MDKEILNMWFLDTTSEIALVNRRIEETRREVGGLRMGRKRGERRIGAAIDASIVRLTSGAARRHADRQSRSLA